MLRVSHALLLSGENLIQGNFAWSLVDKESICCDAGYGKTPEINPIVSVRFREIVLLIVSDEWQRATFSWLRVLYYLMCIDLLRVCVPVCACVWERASHIHTGLNSPYVQSAQSLGSAAERLRACANECLFFSLFFYFQSAAVVYAAAVQGLPQREKTEPPSRILFVSLDGCMLHRWHHARTKGLTDVAACVCVHEGGGVLCIHVGVCRSVGVFVNMCIWCACVFAASVSGQRSLTPNISCVISTKGMSCTGAHQRQIGFGFCFYSL